MWLVDRSDAPHRVRNQIEGVKLTRNPTDEVIVIENTHEPLVSVDLFERVQATFHSKAERKRLRAPSGGRRLLFSSAITCMHCGARYQARPRIKDGRRYDYYDCPGRREGRTSDRCDGWCLNVGKLKHFIFGEIQRRVTADDFQTALRAYLIGRLGQLLRGDVLDTRQIDRDIQTAETKKRRLIDGIAEGLLENHDHHVVEKLAEINDELLRLSARRAEIVKVLGSELDPDAIAAQMLERVHDLASFLDSEDVNDQRKALFAFCEQIVADAETREVTIQTDLLGMAQKQTPPGVPAGLLNPSLPDPEALIVAPPADGLLNRQLPE